MSLINDALKKAQKQRTGETPSLASMPGIGGETPHRIAKRAKPAGFDTLIIRAGVGAGVVLVLTIGGWLVLREKPETGRRLGADGEANLKPEVSNTTQASAPNVGSPLAGGPSVASDPSSVVRLPAIGPAMAGPPSSVQQPAAAPPAQPAFTLPVAQLPAPSSQAQVPASDPQVSVPSSAPSQPTGSSLQVSPFKAQDSPPAASDPQVSSPAIGQATAGGFRSQVSEPAKPAPKLEPRAIQFIENIKVGAIMARSTADAKVLMNDRVYRVGSLVEAEMGLTLVEITTGSLTFEDERGGRYTRTF